MGMLMGGMSMGGYCDDCPRGLRKRPARTTYSNYSDPNKDIEISTSYDTDQRMASITYNLGEHDHIGAFNFIHDPNGKLTMITCVRDTQQNGSWDAEIVSMTLMGDSEGRLTRIYDSISGSDLLQWDREVTDIDQTRETLMIKPVFGDPNSSVSVMNVTGGTGDNIWAGGDELNVVMPEGGGSAAITNLPWPPGDPMPDRVSVDVNWAPLDGSLGDRRIGNRVIVPIMRPDGELAATVDADRIKICSYKGKARKKGLALGANGTGRDEVHFYDTTDSGEIAAMLTMDEYGHAIVSIGGNNGEKASFNFFEAWPSARSASFFEAWPSRLKKEEEEKSTFNFFECWPSTMRGPSEAMVDKSKGGATKDAWDYRNNPERYNFFEAWPSAWGAQPYMPIYSETGDGERYIAGAVTPGGAYSYFQYSPEGELEAIVRMNSIDAIDCTEEIPGDLDNNCKINFKDFRIMAQHWLDCTLEYQEACE
jgi:hypothetical protein